MCELHTATTTQIRTRVPPTALCTRRKERIPACNDLAKARAPHLAKVRFSSETSYQGIPPHTLSWCTAELLLCSSPCSLLSASLWA